MKSEQIFSNMIEILLIFIYLELGIINLVEWVETNGKTLKNEIHITSNPSLIDH